MTPDLFNYTPPASYPTSPGFSNHTTSKDAAKSVEPTVTAIAKRILDMITRSPRTCWEIERSTGLSHQTASARITWLRLNGHIVDSGEKRATGSGRKAIVWRVKA